MTLPITLIGIDTDPVSRTLTRYALERTRECLDVQEILFFGAEPLHIGERFVRIERFPSIDAYSEFVLKCLWPFIRTDYIMIVHWDGFATRPELWQDRFLDYDYIGAPWIWGEENRRVGNGGFCIRSKKLLLECADVRVRRHPEIEGGGGAEDVVICKLYGAHFESRGLRFAPIEVAREFALEYGDERETFDFHGPWVMPLRLEEAVLLKYQSTLLAKLKNAEVKPHVLANCRARGYTRFAAALEAA